MSVSDLVRRFYADLWEVETGGAAPEILHSELRFRGSLGLEKSGIDGFLDYRASVRAALADYRCHIRSLISDGSKAAAQMYFEGRHIAPFQGFEPSGKTVGWAGAAFFEARDGRLADIWVLGDTAGLHAALEANQ